MSPGYRSSGATDPGHRGLRLRRDAHPEDRDALSAIGQPCVAVLNKADLAGFGGPGPMVTAGARCRAMGRPSQVPIVPVAALLVRTSLDDAVFDGLAALAGGGTVPGGMPVKALLAELDLFGIAVAVEALRFRGRAGSTGSRAPPGQRHRGAHWRPSADRGGSALPPGSS